MKIFISKDADELPNEFLDFCKDKAIELLAKSCIEIAFLDFEMPQNLDFIFFASKNAVRSVLRSNVLPKDLKVIAAGKATTEMLEEMGCKTFHHFEKAGEVSENALIFKEKIGEGQVFFPCSDLSNHSYSKVLNADQKIIIQTYQTQTKSQKISPCDVYIFSSPSNFDSFVGNNQLAPNAKIISWGESTSKAIVEQEFEVFRTLKTSGFEELLEILENDIS